MGLKDETFTKLKPNRTYAGTDTRDVYNDGWNVSTQAVSPVRDQRAIADYTDYSVAKTRTKNEHLLAGIYKSPYAIAKQMSESHKRERAEFRSMRSELLKDVIFEYPQASMTRADALAYKAMRD